MTPTHRKGLEIALRVQLDSLCMWQAILVDLTPAERHELHEACITLADAICALTIAERRRAEGD
jgi:hypothetical protein